MPAYPRRDGGQCDGGNSRDRFRLESEEFRAALENAVGVLAAGGDANSAGGAEAAGFQDHPVNGFGVEFFVGAEADAVQGEIGDDDMVVGAARWSSESGKAIELISER
jgi:hypothetical protein